MASPVALASHLHMLSAGSHSQAPVIIVGAGMAGLSAAKTLQAAGIETQVFEASDQVGGRVRTDLVDGFQLDRGFQVYLDAYPNAGKILDLPALKLKTFRPGACIYQGGRFHRMMDPFRCPQYLLSSAFSPIGSLGDKLRVGWLRQTLLQKSMSAIEASPDQTTEQYLQERGFSKDFIDQFFRSFYGGIFLESSLHTSARQFEFTFKHFSHGCATLPEAGMGAIPQQLLQQLRPNSVHLNQSVCAVSAHQVTLAGGTSLRASAVILAIEGDAVAKLLPEYPSPIQHWNPACTLYFAAPSSPIKEPIIYLNGQPQQAINNLCVVSDVHSRYAPQGQALISISSLQTAEPAQLTERVLHELHTWFGPAVKKWRHLRTDRIKRALPSPDPDRKIQHRQQYAGVWLAGDYLSSASIEGAVTSGTACAQAVLAAR
jgi:phytoene dehydrogenase-like protein